jgi:hypothetical protein
MAGPVTHIILALLMLPLLPPDIDKQAFIIGTSFPDIRHTAGISRTATHIEPTSWDDIVHEPSAFRAGMLLHNLVDNARITHLEPYFYDITKVKEYSPAYVYYFPLVQKTAEDAYLYSKSDTWTEIATYFDTILQEELDFGVDEAVLRRWHTMLQTYITQVPTMQSIADFCAHSGHHIYTLCDEFDLDLHFNELCSTPRFADVVDTFYRDFPTHAMAQAYTLEGAFAQVMQMHNAQTSYA